jgi:hypothetical protein
MNALKLSSIGLTAVAIAGALAVSTTPQSAASINGLYYTTSNPLAVASYQTRTAYMRCPRGKVILSGGFNVTPTGGQRRFSVTRSQPGTAPDGAHNWTVTVANHGQDPIQFSISVVCAWAR